MDFSLIAAEQDLITSVNDLFSFIDADVPIGQKDRKIRHQLDQSLNLLGRVNKKLIDESETILAILSRGESKTKLGNIYARIETSLISAIFSIVTDKNNSLF